MLKKKKILLSLGVGTLTTTAIVVPTTIVLTSNRTNQEITPTKPGGEVGNGDGGGNGETKPPTINPNPGGIISVPDELELPTNIAPISINPNGTINNPNSSTTYFGSDNQQYRLPVDFGDWEEMYNKYDSFSLSDLENQYQPAAFNANPYNIEQISSLYSSYIPGTNADLTNQINSYNNPQNRPPTPITQEQLNSLAPINYSAGHNPSPVSNPTFENALLDSEIEPSSLASNYVDWLSVTLNNGDRINRNEHISVYKILRNKIADFYRHATNSLNAW